MKFLLFGLFGLLLSSSPVLARPIASVTKPANKPQITTISRHLPFRFYRPDSEEAGKVTSTAEQEDSDFDGSRFEERTGTTVGKPSEKHAWFRHYPSESESAEDLESRDSNAVPFSQYPPEGADI
ncbi:hypothetical protein R3P38DRAFT_1300057 [Favolaschia claudopus]|uniref:Uncharacterized protein n=1 Tax=Favolaschia claudopus TaxID=2862362 RepID=A0AAW0AYM5_9AGAR